ncbi:MAG: hypothetical protein JRH20_00850 [Deltaproteobacteria bacterium]|nr:hypothetical protein [Deltaproteobacteria bacterium]
MTEQFRDNLECAYARTRLSHHVRHARESGHLAAAREKTGFESSCTQASPWAGSSSTATKEATIIPPTPSGFERSAVAGSTLEDLDGAALEAFVRKRAPSFAERLGVERVATTLGLLTVVGGHAVPTTAGLLLFGELPQLARPEWGLVALRFSGSRISDEVAERLELEGPLAKLLEGAMSFVKGNSHCASANTPEELNTSEYPLEAIREALINALIHRDYRLTGRVALRIFDHRLEIWSPGGAIAPMDLQQAMNRGGTSFARNPILVATARGLGLVEQIGRGLPLIGRLVAESSGRQPNLRSSNSDFLLQLPSRLGPLPTTGPGN